jgi:ubiquitin-protein ligase E3 A
LGLAFFNNVILDIKFPMVIYKKLLNVPVTLEDMKEIDMELYNNFKFIINTKEKGLKDKLCTTFTAIVDHFGEKIVTPLKVCLHD